MERDEINHGDFIYNIYFNSHAHVERDFISAPSFRKMVISTHTLTWSVTPKTIKGIEKPLDFNSHAHVERDLAQRQYMEYITISTHTLTWSVTYVWYKYNC